MNKSFENKMSPALSMFNHIYKEFNEIYHEATLKMGLSDSAFDILYSIVDLGDGCSQSDIVAAQNFCQNFSKLLTKLFGKYFRYL